MDVDLLQNWLENKTIFFVNNKPITIEKISGKKIGAIMPVYVLGGFIDIEKISKNDNLFPLIEDSTEALLEALKMESMQERLV